MAALIGTPFDLERNLRRGSTDFSWYPLGITKSRTPVCATLEMEGGGAGAVGSILRPA